MTDETILTNLYSVQKLLKTRYTVIVNVNLKLTSPSLVSIIFVIADNYSTLLWCSTCFIIFIFYILRFFFYFAKMKLRKSRVEPKLDTSRPLFNPSLDIQASGKDF